MTPRVISAASGLAWGLVGFWLVRDTNMAGGAWAGLMASPLIGLAVGIVAMRARPPGFFGRALRSLVNLYLAVALFAAAVGVWGITLGWGALPVLESAGRGWTFVSSVATLVLWFTVSGWVLLLWLVSIANHHLLWTDPSRGRFQRIVEPQNPR